MRIRYSFVLFSFIFTNLIFPQQPEWLNYTYNNWTFSCLSSGNDLWIASLGGGLIKMDKTTEKLTYYNKVSSNLPDNQLLSISKDSSGNLWLGSKFSGIGKFKDGKCTVFNSTNSGLPFNQINWVITPGSNGKYYIGSLMYFSVFDGKNWKSFLTGASIPYTNTIHDIKEDKDGTVWIAATRGLGRYKDGILTEVYDSLDQEVNSIEFDKSGNMWLGTATQGLIKYEGNKKIFFNTSNSGIPGNCVYKVHFDSKGNLWYSHIGGAIVRFDGNSWEKYTFGSGYIYNLEIDDEDIIWLSTEFGIVKFDGKNYKRYDLNVIPITRNAVYEIQQDNSKNLWFNTYSNLLKYDWNKWTKYDSIAGFSLNPAVAMQFDKTGSMWFALPKQKCLIKYDGTNYIKFDSTNTPLRNFNIECIRFDDKNNLWMGTSAYGVLKFDGSSWTRYDSTNTPMTSNFIADIQFDKKGNVWVGYRYYFYVENENWVEFQGGLAKFNGSSWTNYSTSNSGLPLNNVFRITIDSDDVLWLTARDFGYAGIEYGGGLTRFDGNEWKTYNIYNSQLTSNTIFDIKKDLNDNIWLCTCEGGVVCYDRKGTWKIYRKTNSGIAFDSQNVIFIDALGNKWIGHNESGISVFREGGVNLTDVKDIKKNTLPEQYSLLQNYPNPFNPTTTISYSIPKESHVELKVYDLLGREVSTLVSKEQSAGEYKINFDASSLPSGIYIYTIHAGQYRASKKLTILK